MKQAGIVKTCQTELKYLKQNKDKAQEIRELLSTKETQLASSKESVQRIESQIDPMEVRHKEFMTPIFMLTPKIKCHGIGMFFFRSVAVQCFAKLIFFNVFHVCDFNADYGACYIIYHSAFFFLNLLHIQKFEKSVGTPCLHDK